LEKFFSGHRLFLQTFVGLLDLFVLGLRLFNLRH
jgi:hypothetical protein